MKQDKLMKIVEGKAKPKAKVQKTLSERNIGRLDKESEETTTIYIGNMSYQRKEKEIKEMFTVFGKVTYVRMIMDPKTQKSKGIAFVQMPNKRNAEFAISKLDGTQVDGRTLKVSIAKENPKAAKVARKPKDKDVVDEEVIEHKKPRPSRRKRDKGLKILFNHLNS